MKISLEIAPVETAITVEGQPEQEVRAEVERNYELSKSVTSLEGAVLTQYNPVSNYDALRLLPGVMNAAGAGSDRFSVPTHIRGAGAWGRVETVDDYPSINITPVSAEDGGYTASFSSIIPSLAVRDLALATGGLGVTYGQASGGVVRNIIKQGNARHPYSAIRLEAMTIGEGVFMGETAGGYKDLDYYLSGQGVYGDYSGKFDTFARPIQSLRLGSGLAKVGYKASRHGRLETLFIGGNEDHSYFQTAFDRSLGRQLKRDYHTEKDNYFLATRYDHRPSEDLVFGAGITHNRFRENRIEDFADGQPVGLSRRNRPQQATRAFGNVSLRKSVSAALDYTGSGGAEMTWDRFHDVTTTPIGFSFREQSAYWRNSLIAGGRLAVNTGLRLSRISNGFRDLDKAAYDLGLAYTLPTRTRLRASYSTGYKLNKPFYLWWGGGQFIQRSPAEGLRPSDTKTREVGIEQTVLTGPKHSGLFRVSYFSTDEIGLFNFGDSGSGTPYYDDAEINGLEFWTQWRLWRVRPFASFTHLKNARTNSTNPNARNIDLRFTPLPNSAAGFGSQIDLTTRLSVAVLGFRDDGGIQESILNDELLITRFEAYTKVNAAVSYRWSDRLTLLARVENLLNQRDLGFSRTQLLPDGTSRRLTGTQKDPGIAVGGGFQFRF